MPDTALPAPRPGLTERAPHGHRQTRTVGTFHVCHKHFWGEKQSCARIISSACYYLHFKHYLHTRATISISLQGERRWLSGQGTLEQASPQLQTLRGTIKIKDFEAKRSYCYWNRHTQRQIKHLSIRLLIKKRERSNNRKACEYGGHLEAEEQGP